MVKEGERRVKEDLYMQQRLSCFFPSFTPTPLAISKNGVFGRFCACVGGGERRKVKEAPLPPRRTTLAHVGRPDDAPPSLPTWQTSPHAGTRWPTTDGRFASNRSPAGDVKAQFASHCIVLHFGDDVAHVGARWRVSGGSQSRCHSGRNATRRQTVAHVRSATMAGE